jgi:hypothetical protein
MNRRAQKYIGMIGLAAVTFLGVQRCMAQEDAETTPPAKPDNKAGQHDPVTAAFAIPYGTLLTESQRLEYDRLKEGKEGALREANDAVAAATTWKEKSEARAKLTSLEHEIRAAIRKIMKMSPQDSASASQQAAQQGQQAGQSAPGFVPGYNSYGQAAFGGYYMNPGYGYGYGYPGYGYSGWYGDWGWRHPYGYGSQFTGYPVGTQVGSNAGTPTPNPQSRYTPPRQSTPQPSRPASSHR